MPPAPDGSDGKGLGMWTYRVYDAEGNELGEATFAQLLRPGEAIWLSGARKFEILDVVETLEDSSRYAGLLKVVRAST